MAVRLPITLLLGILLGAVSFACSWASDPIWAKDPRSTTPLFRVVIRGKAGYIDRSGKIVIAPKYSTFFVRSETADFFEGVRIESGFDKASVLVDATGVESAFPDVPYGGPFIEGVSIWSGDLEGGFVDC